MEIELGTVSKALSDVATAAESFVNAADKILTRISVSTDKKRRRKELLRLIGILRDLTLLSGRQEQLPQTLRRYARQEMYDRYLISIETERISRSVRLLISALEAESGSLIIHERKAYEALTLALSSRDSLLLRLEREDLAKEEILRIADSYEKIMACLPPILDRLTAYARTLDE